MHKLESYGNDIYLFTHKKPFVNNTYVSRKDISDAFLFAYDMTFGGKGKHRQKRSGGKKCRSNGEIFVDAFQGKIAEFGFYNYFSNKGYDISKPDVETYPLNKWDSFDFSINDSEIAIKSTKEYGNLLLLETKDWTEDGCYIPNVGTEHAEYDYFVLIRVKSDLSKIMLLNDWLDVNYVSKDILREAIKDINWRVNIVGFITKDEFIDDVIDEDMILRQDSKLGTIPEKTTSMDATNYYVQAGDLHDIEHLIIEVPKKIGVHTEMDKIDLQKLDVSIEYIRRMAEGKNPMNNEVLADESILNNPNVIRCFHYVEGILKMVREREGKNAPKKNFPLDHLKKYEYKKDLSISHFANQLNEGLDENTYNKIKYNMITSWLKSSGYLEIIGENRTNKKQTVPTLKGRELGIYLEERDIKQGKKYLVVMYNRKAQKFILDNMETVLNGNNVESTY